jgi:beta-lactamase regulating signal transducer with metallopeptidase domain
MHAPTVTWLEFVMNVARPVFLESAFDATVVLALAGLVVLALRKGSASLRHRVWTVAIVCLLVLPLVSWVLPDPPVHLPIAGPWYGAGQSGVSAADRAATKTATDDSRAPNALSLDGAGTEERVTQSSGDLPGMPPSAVTTTGFVAEESSGPLMASDLAPAQDQAEVGQAGSALPWMAFGVLAWVAGLGFGLVSLAGSLGAARWLVRTAQPPRDAAWPRLAEQLCAQLGLRRSVPLLTSHRAEVPMTVGWLRPTIVLPDGCDRWPHERRRTILAHELTHVVRRDVLWQTAARLASAVYWFHPLVWLAAWRLRVERETACDDAVLRIGERPSHYASLLLDLASALSGRARQPSAAVATVTGHSMEKRIRAILHPGLCRTPVGRPAACAAAAGAALVLLLVGLVSPLARLPQAMANLSRVDSPRAESETASADPSEVVGDASQDIGAESGEPKEGASEPTVAQQAQVVLRGVVTDLEGEPAAGVSVRAIAWTSPIPPATTDARGRFQFHLLRKDLRGLMLVARSEDGSHQALHRLLAWGAGGQEEPPSVELVLRPARIIPVQVVDQRGQPVAGAAVGAAFALRRVDAGRSDEQGRTTLRVPAELNLEVYAYKAGVGLDYVESRDPIASEEDRPAEPPDEEPDEELALTLDGAITVRVRLIDPENRPLVGVPVYPWLFKKPDKTDTFNLSGLLDEFPVETDARGIAAFDCIPANNEEPITFWTRSPDYWAPQRPIYDPTRGEGEITVPMVRTVRVSGRVRFADGRPAPDIQVDAGGAGYQEDQFRGSAYTDAEGRFEFLVYPDQIYMFLINDSKWAAPVQELIVVRPDTPVDGIDFELRPGTRIHGRVTVGPKREPVVGQYVQLDQYPADFRGLLEDQRLPNPTGSQKRVYPSFVRFVSTDAEGRYEFCAGPGNYNVRGPAHSGTQHFSVEDQESLTFDFQTPHGVSGPITGRVVRRDDSQPMGGAKVVGVCITTERGHADLKVTTDQQGRFREVHWLDKMFFHAESADGRLAGVAEMPAGEQEVTIPVGPLTSAQGRLIAKSDGQPLAHRRIEYAIRIELPNGRLMHRFGGETRTDASGRFILEGLMVGAKYHLNLPLHEEDAPIDDWSWQTLGDFTNPGPKTLDLGDFEHDPPPR